MYQVSCKQSLADHQTVKTMLVHSCNMSLDEQGFVSLVVVMWTKKKTTLSTSRQDSEMTAQCNHR
jgi:hypothetical protein